MIWAARGFGMLVGLGLLAVFPWWVLVGVAVVMLVVLRLVAEDIERRERAASRARSRR